jgi:hypothetical protein
MGHGPRACGYSLIAGLIRVEEIQAGQINHALVLAYPHIRSRYFTYPASTAQSFNGQAAPERGIPCGGRVQLDPSLDVNSLGLSGPGKTIARALQTYGAFVGDFSGAISLYADSSPAALQAWSGVLTSGELDPIDLQSLRVLQWGTLEDNNN